MRSTFSGLNTLVRGIYAQQLSLDTVSHNVSNASTEGYSRQRANLSTTLPDTVYGGSGSLQVGTGVSTQSVTRARDSFVDMQYWKENSSLGYGSASEETLGKIEQIFTDDTTAGTGIQSVLNSFWQSWQTLATNSSNVSAQTAVRERGAELVNTIDHSVEQLKTLVNDVNANLTTKVSKINEIGSEIYGLNKQISNIESGGTDNANDLRDRRDLLTDQLSKLANVRVFEDQEHNYNIQISNVTLVNGNGTQPLAIDSYADPTYGFQVNRVITAGANPMSVQFTSGEMSALQQTNSSVVQGYLDKLSTMSQYLMQEFNAVHRAGFSTDNTTNVNFFGDSGVNYVTSPLATKGEWLDKLKVNSDLYNANGLNKIAIKTSATTATAPANPTIAVVQSDANAGTGTITGTYVPTDAKYHSFIVKIMSTGAGGQATGIQYSEDGGKTYSTTVGGTGTFALPYGLSIKIADNINNTAESAGPPAVAGDTYRFSVPQGNSSGDNATNLANALKQPTNKATSILQGSSLDEFYGTLVAVIGISSEESKNLSTNQQTIINQITSWREATSGVNLDEEMANMIRFQKAMALRPGLSRRWMKCLTS